MNFTETYELGNEEVQRRARMYASDPEDNCVQVCTEYAMQGGCDRGNACKKYHVSYRTMPRR